MSYRSMIQPVDFTDRDLQREFAKAEALALRSTESLADDVAQLLEPTNEEARGWLTPWREADNKLRLRPGEVTICAGYGGNRKTTLTNMLALWLCRQTKVGIASLEMRLPKLLKIMVQQAATTAMPAPDYGREVLRWLEDRLWLYDRLGVTPPLEALGAIHAFHQRGCEVVILDSLQLIGLGDDYDQEKRFMGELGGLARALNVHVIVVHHVRKPAQGGEEQVPTKSSVKGSGALTDLADNVWLCWADKRRKMLDQKLDAGVTLTPQEQDYYDKSCDQKLIVAKQRDHDFEGTIRLYHHPCRQLVTDKRRRPLPFSLGGVA